MEKGYVQIYTGNGKGKSTAAIGLALRAAGSGIKVLIGQFVKSMKYAEIRLIESRIPEIETQLLGEGCFIRRAPSEADRLAAESGLAHLKEKMCSGKYDLIILDEVGIALHYQLLTCEALLAFLDARPSHVELVLTGRYIPQEILDHADLITEMREVRHYYSQGVEARDGIER